MAKKSLQDRLADYLIANGAVEVDRTSHKYRKFTRPGRDDFYWLGSSGAVRVGRTSTGSVSITDRARKWLTEQTYEVYDSGRLVEGFIVTANTLGEALKKALAARPELQSRCQVKLAKPKQAWTDNGFYHVPSSAHPSICRGCTSDESKHGQPIPDDEMRPAGSQVTPTSMPLG